MKLKIFNKKDMKGIRPTIPKVSFSQNGAVFFNRASVELMGLDAGDRILIAQDEERPKDWYITFTESTDGFCLRKAGEYDLAFNNLKIVLKILTSLGVHTGISMQLATDRTLVGDTYYWALITSSLKERKK